MAAAGARRVAARKRQWMIGSSNRDPLDATDVDAFYPGDCLIEAPQIPIIALPSSTVCLTAPSASI